MKNKIYLTIIGLLISGMSYSQLTVKKVTSEVALDGILEESFWNLSNQITINLGGCNNTAAFGVLWDDTYLYVGVIVTDATLCINGRQGWWDDGVEIYIDGNYSQGTTFDQYDRLFVKPVKSYWIQEAEERNEDVVHQWIETSDGYSMEFAIPWDNFNISPSAGMNLGFNVAINDDDNCTSNNSLSQLLWSGTAYYYNNPSTWGTLNLSNQTVSYSGDYIALVSPNGGDFCINNKTTTVNWVSNGISNINIDCSTDNGNSWNSIVIDFPAGSGSFSWNVSANPSEQCLIKVSDAYNSSVNDISENLFTISSALTDVEPLIPNIWDNFQWPYNAYYPEDPNGINGHVGNACGHSSLARILHYWEFPIVGNDELTFTDNGGHTWSANFGETTYNYDNMPNYLPPNSTEDEYTDVATLFYHAATSMHDIGNSGGNLDNMSFAMSHYFRYKESVPYERNNGTKAEWIQTMKNELDSGRVLLVIGMALEVPGNWHETNNVAGHWYHIDGYNEDGYFHLVYGLDNIDDFYDADSVSDYAHNMGILTGLEPELNGKELSLESHNGGEVIEAGEETEITWNSTNVSNIKIEYTLNNGQDWEVITSSTAASSGSYYWTTPVVSSDECKIKLTDVGVINVYDKSNDVFSIQSYELTLITPNGGEYYIVGNSVSITWENTPVSDIKIEYTTDNGSNWTEIIASTSAASGNYDWIIPNIISDQCKVKITDITNNTVYYISDESFEIGYPNNAGGPYAVDDNTILLLHFDGDLTNSSTLSGDGVPHGNGISYSTNTPSNLWQCINLDGYSYITVPHNNNLSLQDDWTIEMWFNINSLNAVLINKPTVSWESNYNIHVEAPDGHMEARFYDLNSDQYQISTPAGTIEPNEWYHVAFINDASNNFIELIVRHEDFSIEFQQSLSYPSGITPAISEFDVTIGDNVDGYIDEVRISDVVRSFENDISADFSGTPTNGNVPLVVSFTDASSQGANPITSWNWDFGDGGTSTNQNPSHTYTSAGSYDVSLTVSDGSLSDTETKTDYITATSVDGPTADFSGTPTSGYAPLDVQFSDASSQGTNPITSWSWDFGDSNTSTDQNPSHTYTATGDYTVTLTVSDGSLSDSETKIDYISVYDPVVSNAGPDMGLEVGQSAQFEGSFTGGSGDITTLWNGVGNSIPIPNPTDLNSFVGPFTEVNIYYFALTITDNITGSVSTDTMFVDVITGVHELIEDIVSVYPNPSKKSVFISSHNAGTMAIYSLTGQKILEKKNFLSGSVNVHGFTKGIYLVVFKGKKGTVTKKFIVE